MAPPNRTARVAVLGSSGQRSRSDRHPSRVRSATVRRSVLALLVLAALTLLTISFRSPNAGLLHTAQGYGASALRPFELAAGRVARPFRDAYGYVDGLTSAKAENAQLRREVQEWQAVANANLAAAREAQGLKALLRYEEGPTYPKDYRTVNASVVSFPSGPFARQLTIAAGSNQGIRLNTPIVSAGALVGHVTGLGPSTAQVTLLSDPDSAVPARDLGTGVSGVIRHGPRNTLFLDRVGKEQVVHKGDVIVTQGTVDRRYPDFFPYGIPVGQVTDVGTSDIASYLTVQVAPFAQLGSLDAVGALITTKPAPKLP